MKLFNSLQIVALFIAWPYLMAYLSKAEFAMANVAYLAAWIFYVIGVVFFTVATYTTISQIDD